MLSGLGAALFQVVQGVPDQLAAALEELLGQPAHEIPEDAREDHEVEHAPAEIAPARRCVPGFSGDCLRGGHGKDQRQRQDKPEVFPFAQNTPPKRSEK